MKITLLVSLLYFTGSNAFGQENIKKIAKKFTSAVISQDDATALINNDEAIILDARELNEYSVSHLKNAKHIGFNNFNIEKTKKLISNSNKKIIVYCSVGYRSGKITAKLRKEGVKAFNLEGGIFDWVNQDRELYNNSGKTKQIHGYDKKWSRLISNKNITIKIDP